MSFLKSFQGKFQLCVGGIAGLLAGIILIPYVTGSSRVPMAAAGFCIALGVLFALAAFPLPQQGYVLCICWLSHLIVTEFCFTQLLLVLGFSITSVVNWSTAFGLLYAVITLNRWAGWWVGKFRKEYYEAYHEVAGKVGPGGMLLYLLYAIILCIAVPIVIHDTDGFLGVAAYDSIVPYVLLTTGGALSSYSLGRRIGFYPLYPVLFTVTCSITILVAFPQDGLWPAALMGNVALVSNLFGTLSFQEAACY